MAATITATELPVHIGCWTNWSNGRITGATLTLTHLGGAFLTAFLALFVAFTGTSFWRLAAFGIHQTLSSDQPQDALYHQVQALLRNSENGSSALKTLIRISAAWRSQEYRPLYRLAPLIGFASVNVMGFAAAGLFSSRIGSALGNEVLLSGSACGTPYNSINKTLQDVMTIWNVYENQQITSHTNYAQRCYSNAGGIEGCSPFVKSRLPTSTSMNASCPFRGNICRYTKQNIKLDTGYLDTHFDMGLNTPPGMRIQLRVVNHCAPLVTDGYTESYEFSDDRIYSRYMYGGAKSDDTDKKASVNYTYQYEQRSVPQLAFENFTSAFPDYSLRTPTAFSFNGSLYAEVSTFFPLEELHDGDSDTVLFFLSTNGILFIGEVDDPWFSAHQPFHHSETSIFATGKEQFFLSDEPAAVLGCKMQYQVCDVQAPSAQNCSNWGGLFDLDPSQAPYRNKPGKANRQEEVLSWIFGSLYSFDAIVDLLKSSSLLAKSNTRTFYQTALPANQWQLEVQNWHNIMLAMLQGGLVNSAIGPNDERMLEKFWRRPDSEVTRSLCKNQKIKSTAYSNFSILGLVIVFAFGSLIIILDLTLESIIVFVEGRRGTLKYSRLEWFTNDVLETQRLAHEELGLGTWEGCAGVSVVPVTRKGDLLAVLDISDPEHPRLKVAEGQTAEGKLNMDADTPAICRQRGRDWNHSRHHETRIPTQDRQRHLTWPCSRDTEF